MVFKERKNMPKFMQKQSSKHMRIQLDQIVRKTQVSIFKSDPITWIPKDHVMAYKREITWQLYEMTNFMNMECWGVIVDMIFQDQSKVIFSLVYQLSKANYHRSTLSCLTSAWESYEILKKLSNIFNMNFILYKPNSIPQYLKVKTHYLNIITTKATTKKTMLIYTEPIEYFYSMDFNFQLSALTDLRFEEEVKVFFDMNKCLIDFQDYDKIGNIDDESDKTSMEIFRQKVNEAKVRCKTFVALWSGFEDPENLPDEWWPYRDDRPLTIEEFILILIKVSTSNSGTVYIIYKNYFYCICDDTYESDMMVCKIHDNGVLYMPLNLKQDDFGTLYQRRSLISLVNENKDLYVY